MTFPPASFFDELCAAAARETLPRFKTALDITNKREGDFDPVTEADRKAEQVMRALIEEKFPDHGILGEEFGAVRPDADFQWILDPVDGTRAFICGVPVWGTLIGLYHRGAPMAGVMDQPFTQERFLAIPEKDGTLATKMIAKGREKRLATRQDRPLNEATLMATAPDMFAKDEYERFDALARAVNMTRYGGDCYAYCMLAAGHIDLVAEAGLKIHDIAAIVPIIRGAGGVVTDWSGQDPAKGGKILAAANEKIHQKAINFLA